MYHKRQVEVNVENKQKREKIVLQEGVEVHSIFKTIQGEGIFSGHSSVFVRLAGCNLMCQQCDTEYTSKRSLLSKERVLQEVESIKGNSSLVVITGGEPFRQNITPLVETLLAYGLKVQIETNGTLPPNIEQHKNLYVVVSPKTAKIHPKIREIASCYKYVADFVDELNIGEDGLPLKVLGVPCIAARPCKNKPVYIQPTDLQDETLNKINMAKVAEFSLKFGFIFQLQIHKIVGME